MLCAQLVHEQKSRVASCWPYDMVNIKRYTCAMEAEGLGMHHWRKSALWFTMPREHAKLVIAPLRDTLCLCHHTCSQFDPCALPKPVAWA